MKQKLSNKSITLKKIGLASMAAACATFALPTSSSSQASKIDTAHTIRDKAKKASDHQKATSPYKVVTLMEDQVRDRDINIFDKKKKKKKKKKAVDSGGGCCCCF